MSQVPVSQKERASAKTLRVANVEKDGLVGFANVISLGVILPAHTIVQKAALWFVVDVLPIELVPTVRITVHEPTVLVLYFVVKMILKIEHARHVSKDLAAQTVVTFALALSIAKRIQFLACK